MISVTFVYDEEHLEDLAARKLLKAQSPVTEANIRAAVTDGCERLLFPSIEREIRSDLSQRAQGKSIEVFSMRQMALALPEDIAKAKWAGDFARAERLIHLRLEDPRTAQCMRKRLELEQEVLRRLPASYPYTEAEGLALIQKEIPDFTMAELRRWEDRDAADWIYINGVTHLQDRFYESM